MANAADLFDRGGYHATSVAQLARAVGLSKPTLYHYFSSKDEILFAIHEEFIDLLVDRQHERAGMAPGENLREIMRDILGLMDSHRGHIRVFFEHYRELAPEHQETIRRKRDAYAGLVEGVIRRGIDDGTLRPVDPRLTALALFGMCNWSYQWYRSNGPRAGGEIADFFFDLLVNGIGEDDR